MSMLQENAFLHKLWTMLEIEENAHILNWNDEGDRFHVLDIEAMEKYILPKYFRHSKFSSFQRQLNYFGFKKVGKGKVGPIIARYNILLRFYLIPRRLAPCMCIHYSTVLGRKTAARSKEKRKEKRKDVL
jgi:hypothetical protein